MSYDKDSQNDMYRIVTINCTYATNDHVHKNIYEQTLGEFLEWHRGMDEGDEEVLSIMKIEIN